LLAKGNTPFKCNVANDIALLLHHVSFAFGSASLAVRAFERPCLHFPEGFMTHSANARASRCANVEMGFWWLNVPPTIIA